LLSEAATVQTRLAFALLLVPIGGAAVVYGLHRWRRSRWLQYPSYALIGLVFIGALFVPVLAPKIGYPLDGVWIARAIGPLAMIVVDALLLFVFVAVLTVLSRLVGFPIMPVVVVIALVAIAARLNMTDTALCTAILFAFVAVLAVMSGKWHLGLLSALLFFIAGLVWLEPVELESDNSGAASGDPPCKDPKLATCFEAWLDARAKDREANPSRDYPVFIIAAEGGGIFAATAASAFLSRLQDQCPEFAQHVFAISGVSGGAVGASVFQNMVQGLDINASGCDSNSPSANALSANAAEVIQGDHLSPLLGLLIADALNTYGDRAKGLVQSLTYSMSKIVGDEKNGLGRPFDRHWDPRKAAPALVLNVTSVETGYRVAYAPFCLTGVGGSKTLYSIADFSNQGATLAEATVSSARFPAILPALVTRKDRKRRDFVDGGYADSSGALTALDIFDALSGVSVEKHVNCG
jgi:hypothetical protein